MVTSGKETSIVAALGLIAASAGIATYYYLFLLKKENKKSEDQAVEETSKKPLEAVPNLVVTENITDLQKEVDSCKTPPIPGMVYAFD